MNQSNIFTADLAVQQLRDTMVEDSVLDTAIDMLAGVAECLNEVRQIPLG